MKAGRQGEFPGCGCSNTAPYSQNPEKRVTVDWLTLVQEHTRANLLGSALLLFVDPETGAIDSQAVKSQTHEGSYDSRLLVRSDGRRVEVSGNPSRWNAPHSLDGLGVVDDAIELYNGVLRALGLPEFFAVERSYIASLLLKGGADGAMASEGMRITRIDLARLYETGGPDKAALVVRALGQVTHAGKQPMLYGHGETVAWGTGSRHAYIKYYAKGPEMLRHGGAAAKDAAEWAMAVGLVRHEVSLKAMWLAKNGLQKPACWTEAMMEKVIERYAMHQRVGASSSSYHRIYEELLDKGLSKLRARRAQEAAFAYLAGHVFERGRNVSKDSFYRLRADLRRVGLDISSPLNVSTLRFTVKVIEMKPAVLPTGFRRSA